MQLFSQNLYIGPVESYTDKTVPNDTPTGSSLSITISERSDILAEVYAGNETEGTFTKVNGGEFILTSPDTYIFNISDFHARFLRLKLTNYKGNPSITVSYVTKR
jgi:hypothetical protein